MGDRLPLSALLSQVFTAFAIEFDNEFEHRAPHRTTVRRSTIRSGPWLVSMTMWLKFLQFVPGEGITVREFQRQAALTTPEAKRWLTRLTKWWGYLTIDQSPPDHPPRWLIRPAPGAQKAFEVCRPLIAEVEQRWHARFGERALTELLQTLHSLVDHLNPDLPATLPILGYDLLSPGPPPKKEEPIFHSPAPDPRPQAPNSPLPILLSKALLSFAIEFERGSHQSLAVSANLLRLLTPQGTLLRDLPRLSGVSKEAIAVIVKRAQGAGLAAIHQSTSRFQSLSLTAKGSQARDTYHRLASEIETRWQAAFDPVVTNLRQFLERLAGAPLFQGIQPYPNSWRAALPAREVLPHYPMILHRGAFPDGS